MKIRVVDTSFGYKTGLSKEYLDILGKYHFQKEDDDKARKRLIESYYIEDEEEYEFIAYGHIEIGSLEDCISLSKDVGHEIIITTTVDKEPAIEIYDGYRE